MEIAIHRTLNHKGVVGFHGFFEDDDYIYILLELCRRRVSLFCIYTCIKERQRPTVPSVRLSIQYTQQQKTRQTSQKGSSLPNLEWSFEKRLLFYAISKPISTSNSLTARELPIYSIIFVVFRFVVFQSFLIFVRRRAVHLHT